VCQQNHPQHFRKYLKEGLLDFNNSYSSAEADWATWETEWSFGGHLRQEYSYKKLLKSDNPS